MANLRNIHTPPRTRAILSNRHHANAPQGAGGFALTASVCGLGLSLAAARVAAARLDALGLFVAAAQLVGFVTQANVAF